MKLLILFSILALAAADLPIHCLLSQVYGTWNVKVGVQGKDKTIDCKTFDAAKTMTLTFQAPNIVIDQATGSKGTFTMMDDEGIEMFIDGLDYFTWFHYDPAPYKCDVTANGWYHATPAGAQDWGCWSMAKTSATRSTMLNMKRRHQKPVDENAVLFTKETATEICAYVNSVQKSWVCDPKAGERFIGKSVRELRAMSGPVADRFRSRIKTLSQIAMPKGLPEALDWRNMNGVNYVSPVRDQAFCGSCYSFAATGALEARIRVFSNNTLQPILAPQDIVSCDKKYSQGCSGGFDYTVGKYAEDFGIVEESCFPYTSSDSTACSKKCAAPAKIWTAKEHAYIGGYNGNCSVAGMMEEMAARGPISVAILWGAEAFFYRSGVYVPVEGGPIAKLNWEKTNHAVLAVGWKKESNQKVWIIKNSWGASWGDKGYFTLVIGTDKIAVESEAVKLIPNL
eukprot:TRINITY_DN7379_c0_g1_i1.p1 TRINITY_DN7379_c0_g1~~TRINITY_DN7379_c0_g1_i1.p1  ORF type:complete len:453 (-),score=102.83 TRINITY_DN7379_c0_g1_i1:161-1519(-)